MSGRRRIDVIVNPIAGSRGSGLFDEVLRCLRDAGVLVRCMETQSAGHATELATFAAAEGVADVIVAAGGDGTINEVARGLIGQSIPLGVLPLGTANVLGIEIGQKLRAKAVADTLLYGEAIEVGTGLVNDELFLLMVGVGFDGAVVHAIKPAMKRRIGKFAFIWEGLKVWVKGPCADISLQIDGVDEKAAWVIVTNARHYAGPFTLSRTTGLCEPGLDVFLFRKSSRMAFACYFLGLGVGHVAHMPGVGVLRARKVDFFGASDLRVEVDGDAIEQSVLKVEQGGELLRLVMPRG